MPPTRKSTRADTAQKTDDLRGFAAEFQNEGDRAAAILAAALLDEWLLRLLTAYLIDDRKQVDLLLGQEQPLGSFGARIRVAYCLGLLDNELFGALTTIKRIRNAFAHQLHGLKFDSPAVAGDCAKLREALRIPDGFAEMADTSRAAFMHATYSVLSSLRSNTTFLEVTEEKRCKVPEWKTLFHWTRSK